MCGLISIIKGLNIHKFKMDPIRKMWCSIHDQDDDRGLVGIDGDVMKVWSPDAGKMEKPLKKYASTLHKIRIRDEFDDDIPSSIYKLLSKCTELKYARLDCRELDKVEPFLKYLPTDNLEDLSIDVSEARSDRHDEVEYFAPNVNPLIANVLAKSPKLKTLDLGMVPITELPSIGGTGTLKSLYIKPSSSLRMTFDVKQLENLETLCISYDEDNIDKITELVKNCRKLHSVRLDTSAILPETTINELMSLPNLRRLELSAGGNSCESWYKFSNLETIEISQKEPLLTTKDQIRSFLERSKNLKTFEFSVIHAEGIINIRKQFKQVAAEMGHEFDEYVRQNWTYWDNAIPF